jgi:uncharacterized protein (TIGR03067 family)
VRKRAVLPLLILMIGFVPGCADTSDNGKILGTWKVVVAEEDGEKAPSEKFRKWTIVFTTENKVTVNEGGGPEEGTFSLDPSKSPKEIDLKFKRPGGEDTVKALYSIDGDELKICGPSAKDRPRPKEISSKKAQLMILMREP